MSRTVRFALLFFFLSGITGLVYEVLWTRRLTLTFGHTVLAVSTVLTAYMAGLALGSLAGGRWADRRAEEPGRGSPADFLAAYGALELLIGAWALLSLPLLGLVEWGYLALARQGLEGSALHLAAFSGSVLVLLPPTMAMGATLPVMSRLLVHEREAIGRLLSRLYGINTLGAFAGAALAGFVLLPALGLVASLALGAAVNLAVGGAAFGLGRSRRLERGAPAPEPPAPPEPAPPSSAPGFVVPLAFGLAGVASMAWQVGWTRGLVLSFGSSTYAFSTILAAFLAGLGLGSLLYSRLMGRREPGLAHLAWLQLLVGVLGGATIWALERFPLLFFDLYPHLKESYWRVLGVEFVLSGLLLLGPTFLMGLMFPLASHLYTRDLRLLGRSVGEVYSANTLGCIAGSFLAGFVAVPLLGAQWTLKAASLVNLAVGVGLFLVSGARAVAVLGLLAVVAVVLLPRWDPAVMSAGLAVYAARYEGSSREDLALQFRPPAFYRDGISCTVSLHVRSARDVFLRVNGKTDASLGSADLQTTYLLGLLPALAAGHPKTAAVIGLGSGMTLDALAALPGMERIDCAELEPAVVEVGRYWRNYNGAVLEDPRVQVYVTDGRTFILGSPRLYDLIVSEPSNPWIAGIGNLFTRDFYEKCRERLAPGGVMAQWVHLYSMSEREVGMVVRSFYEVFPEGSVWQSSFGDLVLLGHAQPVRWDPAALRQAWESNPRLQEIFYRLGLLQPESLMGHFLVDRAPALARFATAPLNTDDRPLLEFSAPFNLYRTGQAEQNADLLRRLRESPLPPGVAESAAHVAAAAHAWVNIGNYAPVDALLSSDAPLPGRDLLLARFAARVAPEGAAKAYDKAVRADPADGAAAAGYAELLLEKGQWAEAARRYEQALAHPPAGSRGRLLAGAGVAARQAGQRERAVDTLRSAAAQTSDSWPLTELGRTLYDLGRFPEALSAVEEAARRNPADVDALLGRGSALLALDRPEEAAEAFQRALDVVPDHVEALVGLGVSEARGGHPEAARRALRQALALAPDHAAARQHLATLEGGVP